MKAQKAKQDITIESMVSLYMFTIRISFKVLVVIYIPVLIKRHFKLYLIPVIGLFNTL